MSKMIPLMYSLSMFLYCQKDKRKILVLGAATSVLVCIGPILISLIQDGAHILSSLDLYLKKFEFNGSLYYLLRAIGYEIYGFNTIHIWGPILTLTAIAGILYLSFQSSIDHFKRLMNILLWVTMIFLVTSRTIHPWYLSLVVFYSIFTSYGFPLVWSYLIYFTYINYSYSVYQENLLVVFLEYFILLLYIWYELKYKKPQKVIS